MLEIWGIFNSILNFSRVMSYSFNLYEFFMGKTAFVGSVNIIINNKL